MQLAAKLLLLLECRRLNSHSSNVEIDSCAMMRADLVIVGQLAPLKWPTYPSLELDDLHTRSSGFVAITAIA